MAQECGFFNAQLVGEEYDRVYLAEQFAAYFASFIGNGVFGSSMQQLEVVANNDMTTNVLSGQAWINGWWYRNTDVYTLSHSVADGVLSRIDIVVLRWDHLARDMYLAVIEGTPSANPVKPAIVRNADYYDLQLCTVSIPAGSIRITQAQITDTRLDNSVCGLVTGVVDQIDTTSLFSQFMTAYQEWKDNQQADYEDWTDVQKAAYNQFVSDTEGDYTDFVNQSKQDYTNYTTGKQEEFNTWYTTYLTAFQTAIEAWFENIKGHISEDAAVHIQLELNEHEALLNGLQHMLIQNDIFCPIELSDGSILVTNDDEAILMDWSYVEAPCTCSTGATGPKGDKGDKGETDADTTYSFTADKATASDGTEQTVTVTKVNGHTVEADVPANAKFTDTVPHIETTGVYEDDTDAVSGGAVYRFITNGDIGHDANSVKRTVMDSSLSKMGISTPVDYSNAKMLMANAGRFYKDDQNCVNVLAMAEIINALCQQIDSNANGISALSNRVTVLETKINNLIDGNEVSY